jgi:hypothetical protein
MAGARIRRSVHMVPTYPGTSRVCKNSVRFGTAILGQRRFVVKQ